MNINKSDNIVYTGEMDASEETNKFTFQITLNDMIYNVIWEDRYPKVIEYIEGGNVCLDEWYSGIGDKISKMIEHWFDTHDNKAWWRENMEMNNRDEIAIKIQQLKDEDLRKIYRDYVNHGKRITGFDVTDLLERYNEIYFKSGGNALCTNMEESKMMVKTLLKDIKNEMVDRFFRQ